MADRPTRAWVWGLLLLTALIAAPLWHAGWLYEDDHWLPQTPTSPATWSLPGRDLTALSYHLTWRVAGWDPTLYHVGNIAVHLVNGGLLYAVGSRLIPSPAALVASGIFLLHPLQSQAVSYVTARTDLLMTLGVLLAVWLSLGRMTVWQIGGIGLVLLGAALSKEIGLIGVPLVLWTLLCLRPSLLHAHAALFAPLWIAGGMVAGASWATWMLWMDRGAIQGVILMPWSEFLPRQTAAVWHLLRPDVWLWGLTIDHDMAALSGRTQFLSLLLTGQMLVLAGVAFRRWPVLAWAIGWVTLSIVPRMLFRTHEWITEAQLYLAMVGLSVLSGRVAYALWTWTSPRLLTERTA